MKKAILLLVFCGAFVGHVFPLKAQSTMEQAIAASFPLTKSTADQSDIVTAGAVMTLKKDHVIMFATTASSRASLNYKDGKITPSVPTRLAAFSLMGRPATNIVQRTYVAGEKLWLIGVQVAGDGVSLQFLSDPVGDVRYACSIKFPFAKGATPTSQQVVAQIGEVIAPDSGAAPAAPAQPPAEAPIVAPPPPGGSATASGKSWRIQPAPGGTEAAIAGIATAHGQQGPVVLALTCSQAYLRLRRKTFPSADSFSCDSDATTPQENLEVSFAVGDRSLEAGSVCNWIDMEGKAPPAVLELFLDFGPSGLKEIVESPGSPLQIHLDTSSTSSKSELLATFSLPQDASTIAFLNSCKASQDAPPLQSCPDLPGKGLRKADVLTEAGRSYRSEIGDGDTEWDIPGPTKAHPARPRFTLACFYGAGLKQVNDKETLERKLYPISGKAKACHLGGEPKLGEVSASCS